jgi:Na+-transporting methylmalonyl-CoA/oxaloacetate decarboxylase gamma subunit
MVAVVILVLILLAFLVVVLAGVARRADFADRFPSISDAEFVARCRPGTTPAVALAVRRIVARNLGIDYARVHPDMSFVDALA